MIYQLLQRLCDHMSIVIVAAIYIWDSQNNRHSLYTLTVKGHCTAYMLAYAHCSSQSHTHKFNKDNVEACYTTSTVDLTDLSSSSV